MLGRRSRTSQIPPSSHVASEPGAPKPTISLRLTLQDWTGGSGPRDADEDEDRAAIVSLCMYVLIRLGRYLIVVYPLP